MGDDRQDRRPARSGTIIRARNGDVLRYDSTGMVMVLSDRVISDIARRLPPHSQNAQRPEWIDPLVLGDIDAWDLRRDGEWLIFGANLPGAQGPRQFRRLAVADGADLEPGIFADGAGPLRGIFSLGGPRRATGFDEALRYPWHVLAPADDLGAVGHAGTEAAQELSTLEKLPELTRDAALADALVERQHKAHKALSLFVTRSETDGSASVAVLAQGSAYANLLTAMASLKAAAARLGRPAALYALGFDFVLEDVKSDAQTYAQGVLALLDRLTSDIAGMGLRCPPVIATFDCGTHHVSDSAVLRAQWELAWQGADHGLTYTAPGYMFHQDRFGRPTAQSLREMAEMDAAALAVLHDGEAWTCPVFLLAERAPDPTQIRVRARAMDDLVIDTDDPFGAGPSCGFSLSGVTNDASLTDVSIAEDDAQDVILTFDRAPEGEDLRLHYAFGMTLPRKEVDYPMACGALRDRWSIEGGSGRRLHRWALPAVLPVW